MTQEVSGGEPGFLNMNPASLPTMDNPRSSGGQGAQNHTDNLPTWNKAAAVAPPSFNQPTVGQMTTYGSGLQSEGLSAGMGLLAPASTDGSNLPSGVLSYGFPTLGPLLFPKFYTGVDNKSATYGAPLPSTSTASYDFNTVDCPYLRENYANGVNSGGLFGLLNINIPLGNGLGLNAGQTINQLSNFFNGI